MSITDKIVPAIAVMMATTIIKNVFDNNVIRQLTIKAH
jgi:hypothetical protein